MKLATKTADVRRASAAWRGLPSGLSRADVSTYIALGHHLAGHSGETWVLDLGTYFGHSALTILQGAKAPTARGIVRVLSVDIFEQPAFVHAETIVQQFIRRFGATDAPAIGRALAEVCASQGLDASRVRLLTQDVTTMKAEKLLQTALQGFRAVLVDCGKTPRLMNAIGGLIANPTLAPVGCMVAVQDFFDWHAPWNAVWAWGLLQSGNAVLCGESAVASPVLEIRAHAALLEPCDRSEPGHTGDGWDVRFQSVERELQAFDGWVDCFRRGGLDQHARQSEAMRIGAFLRTRALDEAREAIEALDVTWPLTQPDAHLQDAYRRLRHLETGVKDLTITIPSAYSRRRHARLTHVARRLAQRWRYR